MPHGDLVNHCHLIYSRRLGLCNWPLHVQDLHKAMKMLGLNPMEQEVVDIPNEIARSSSRLPDMLSTFSSWLIFVWIIRNSTLGRGGHQELDFLL
jgi:hypothetical protein